MLTTMVENFTGFRDGIMGRKLMGRHASASGAIGTDRLQGNVAKVDLSRRPFKLDFGDTTIYTER